MPLALPRRDIRMRIVSPHGRTLDLCTGKTELMGVLNVTPDSFSDGGRFATVAIAVAHAESLVAAGAGVLDIGGESTRPGHSKVSASEQLARILPVLRAMRSRVDVPISIDTTRAEVAEATLDAGADWINDTSALGEDPDLARVVARHRAPIVLMHRFEPARSGTGNELRGPALVAEIVARLSERVALARSFGIADEQILLDPGIGFGTTAEDALTLIAHAAEFHCLRKPIVMGPSRKSFLGAVTQKPAAQRLFATAAAVAALALAGVGLIRVHDVAEMRDVTRIADAIAAQACT